jgi:hypothetical protein
MELTRIQKTLGEDTVKLSGFFRRAGRDETQELYYEYPRAFENFVSESGNAFAPPLLLVAMAVGENLSFTRPCHANCSRG